MYSSQGIDATGTPNGTPVSVPANNTVGVGQDRLPTSDTSSVPSTSNVAWGQREVNGVDNAKLGPYRDAVAQIMSQAGRDKSYLSKEDKKEAPVNASGEGYDSSTATTATPTLTRRNGETDASSMSSVEQGQEEVNGEVGKPRNITMKTPNLNKLKRQKVQKPAKVSWIKIK